MSEQTPGFTPSDWRLWDALVDLQRRAGVAPGEPFRTTRVAMIVESGLKPLTMDCCLYRLARDGFITRDGKRGSGTAIQLLAIEDERQA